MNNYDINVQQQGQKGRVYIEDESNNSLAEMTFSMAGSAILIIDHTEVSDQLRGMKMGRKLLEKVVKIARDSNYKIIPICPFAKSVFDKDEALQDVLR